MTLFLFLTAVGAYAADGFLHTDGSFSSAVNRKTTFAEQRKESFLSGKGQEISKHVKERLFEGTQIENLTDNAKKRLFEETQVEDLTDNAKLRFRQIMETAENFVRRVKGIANH